MTLTKAKCRHENKYFLMNIDLRLYSIYRLIWHKPSLYILKLFKLNKVYSSLKSVWWSRKRQTQSHRKTYVLFTSPIFRYTTLCDCIEHYTARIDYNQDILQRLVKKVCYNKYLVEIELYASSFVMIKTRHRNHNSSFTFTFQRMCCKKFESNLKELKTRYQPL